MTVTPDVRGGTLEITTVNDEKIALCLMVDGDDLLASIGPTGVRIPLEAVRQVYAALGIPKPLEAANG